MCKYTYIYVYICTKFSAIVSCQHPDAFWIRMLDLYICVCIHIFLYIYIYAQRALQHPCGSRPQAPSSNKLRGLRQLPRFKRHQTLAHH